MDHNAQYKYTRNWGPSRHPSTNETGLKYGKPLQRQLEKYCYEHFDTSARSGP